MRKTAISAGHDDAPATSARLLLLGPPLIVCDGSLRPPGTQKALALAGYLGIRAEPVAREQLATLLWAESGSDQARRSLRGELARLRTVLPDGGIRASRLNIWLEPCCVDVDARQFWALLADGRDEDAVELYRGPLFEGLDLRNAEPFEDWLRSERHLVKDGYLQALRRLIVAGSERGDSQAVLRWTWRALQCQPLAEDFYVHAMEAAQELGDRATVLSVYQKLDGVLRDELGIGPGTAARALARRASGAESMGNRPTPGLYTSRTYVGREREQALLREALHKANTDCGSLAFVHGPAGVGKTRLLQVVFGRHLGVWCSAQRPVSTVAYYPIATGLREHLSRRGIPSVDDLWLREAARVCPELSRATPNPSLGGTEDKIRLIEGLSATLAGAADRGGVLVFDDVQWADPDTVAVLEDLVERLPRLHVAIAIVARDGDNLESNGVADVVATAARGGYLTEVAIEELPRDQVLELIRTSHPDIVARVPAAWLEEFAAVVHEVLGGNPFYALECARLALNGSGKLPAGPLAAVKFGARDLLGTRLAALPPHVRQVAVAAAVAGEVSPDVLARMLGTGPWQLAEHLDSLVARGVLTTSRTGLCFTHDLLAEVIYESLRPAKRQLLHKRAALALARAYAMNLDDVSGRIATHFEAAGLEQQAIPYHERAAEAARRAHAHQTAIYHYQRLRALIPRDQQTPLLLQLGEILSYESSGEAEVLYREALQLARIQGDGHTQARCYFALGVLLRRRSDLSGSRQALTEALRRFDAYGDTEGVEQALEALTYAYIQQGELRAAASSASQAAEIARDTGRIQNLGRATLSRGIAHLYGGEYKRALQCFQSAGGIARDTADDLAQAEALRYLSAVYGIDGRAGSPGQAWAAAEESIAICSRLGHRTGLARAADGAGGAYLLNGDWPRALQCYVAALHLKDRYGYAWGFDAVVYRVGYTLLLAGENDRARRALKHAEVLARKLHAPYWLCRTLLAAAELALCGGDRGEGGRLAAASIELAGRLQHREFLSNARALASCAGRAGHKARTLTGDDAHPYISGRLIPEPVRKNGWRIAPGEGTATRTGAALPDVPQVLEAPVSSAETVIAWLDDVVDRQLGALPDRQRRSRPRAD